MDPNLAGIRDFDSKKSFDRQTDRRVKLIIKISTGTGLTWTGSGFDPQEIKRRAKKYRTRPTKTNPDPNEIVSKLNCD